jgi:hypothetical protein
MLFLTRLIISEEIPLILGRSEGGILLTNNKALYNRALIQGHYNKRPLREMEIEAEGFDLDDFVQMDRLCYRVVNLARYKDMKQRSLHHQPQLSPELLA